MRKITFLVIFSVLCMFSCSKEQKPSSLPDYLKGNARFEGSIWLENKSVKDFMATSINLQDSLIGGPSFGLNVATYELVEEEFYLSQIYFTDHMLLNDTTFFKNPPSPFTSSHCGFQFMSTDYVICAWRANDLGWCFVEKLDAGSYAMHLEAKVIKKQETCIADRGYGDTVDLVIKGVLRLY